MDDYSLDLLIEALLEGDQSMAISETLKLLNKGVDREQIITGGVEQAMSRLDAKCTVEQFNLLEIMLASRASMSVIKTLFPDSTPSSTRETVVLASLEGDVHDLGKNIVKTVMIAKGYRVVDCGKDCPLEKLLDTAVQEKASIISISGLITSVIPLVKKIVPLARMRGLTGVRVMAGGAALKQASADFLNVDYVADSVFDGMHYLEVLSPIDDQP